MKHSEEINNQDKTRKKRSAIARGKKDQYPQYDFGKFPYLQQSNSECRMDGILWNWPNEENERPSFFF